MKVYRVTKDYFDGDHDHGIYQSPLFAKKEDAEAFAALVGENADENKQWWTETDRTECSDPYIEELEVLDGFDGNVDNARRYLTITFT